MTNPKEPTPGSVPADRRSGTDRRDTDRRAARPRTDAPAPLAPGTLNNAVPLRDALTGIGEMWQLPPKAPTRPNGMPAVDGERRRNTRADGTRAVTQSNRAVTQSNRAVTQSNRAVTQSSRAVTQSMGAIPAASSRRPLLFGAAMALALIVGVVAWRVMHPPLPKEPMPDDLMATWSTRHPQYSRNSMTITDQEITFRTADPSKPASAPLIITHHPVRGFQSKTRGDTSEVLLTYVVDGENMELTARLIAGQMPRLEFPRPQGLVWISSRGIE